MSLYVGPVAAGAIGGALDAGLTWGLKAIPGGQEAGSWQEGVFDILTGAALGGLGGKPGGGGLSKLSSKFRPSKHLDALRETGFSKVNKLGGRYVKQHWGGQVIKELVVGGAVDAVSASAFTATTGGVSWVWNQVRDPLADAWADAQTRGLNQYAWRP
jgi:hypothetical protein